MEKLWKFYGDTESPKELTPYEVLTNAASKLQVDTNGLIIGLIADTTSSDSPEIVYAFYFVVPKLKNYHYRIFEFTIKNLINPFPIKGILYAKELKNNQYMDASDLADFKNKLNVWIDSPLTRGILTFIKDNIDAMDDYNKIDLT